MKPLPRRLYAITAIMLAAIIFVAINIAADTLLTSERLDLTETGVYTMATGTKHIVANLKEPITLKFYYSKKIASGYAQINAYAKRVRDLLEEYAARSDGKIILEEIDPEPFTPEEDEANADGLSGAPTDSGDQVFFGLVGSNTIGGQETIPFFSDDREAYIEYDISSLVYRLSTPKKPLVGIISSLPLDTGAGGVQAAMQGQSRPFMIYEELSQTYATKMLDPNFSDIPPGVDVLMIVHPGTMTPAQLYAIDQFVLKGGRALVFVDPLSEIATAGQGMGGEGSGPTSSDLPSLFRAWGVGYDPSKVIGDKELAQAVKVSGDPRNPVAEFPTWLKLGAKNFASNDQVTASMQVLNLASAGALSPLKGATTTFVPLISSSNEASLLDAQEVRASPQPQDLMADVQPTGRNYVIAARISGVARTSFPGGPPLSPADAAKAPPEIKSSAGPINVIVMADSDIFDDRFWVQVENLDGKRLAAPFADNAAFVLNAVQNLTGSNDLISLRTRATNNRPFTVVLKLQADAQAKFQQQAEMLKQQLSDTESRLHALEQGGTANGEAASGATLAPEQQAEIERFKRQLTETRTALRDVQHNLRKDIDALGAFLAFVNIALMPLLVGGVALVLAVLRRRRRTNARGLDVRRV
jgi:ABC-type uncharacterized transport system involved in gliding motility auxiliary subunit